MAVQNHRIGSMGEELVTVDLNSHAPALVPGVVGFASKLVLIAHVAVGKIFQWPESSRVKELLDQVEEVGQ
jgi:hypothetical protein